MAYTPAAPADGPALEAVIDEVLEGEAAAEVEDARASGDAAAPQDVEILEAVAQADTSGSLAPPD